MEFSKKKLPQEAAESLHKIPLENVKPYSLVMAPTYVFLQKNLKFIAIKGPLDFFKPEELDRLAPYELFYVSNFIDSLQSFIEAAHRVRALMNSELRVQSIRLPPYPYELSNEILKKIGPLWGGGAVIDAFFVLAFVNELCAPIPGELLQAAHDANVDLYERALFISSWCIFLALHLGYCDLIFLNNLYIKIFKDIALKNIKKVPYRNEVEELVNVAIASFEGEEKQMMVGDRFSGSSQRVARKLSARLTRVKSEMILGEAPVFSVYGPRGFI